MDEDEEVNWGVNDFKNKAFMGTPLAEVFSVSIATDDTDECQIYGTIQVIDCNGSLFIYNKKREDAETIHRVGNLGIISEEHAISGDDHFTVRFNLIKRKNGEDVVLINGSFVWNEGMGYDTGLSAEVFGEHSSAKATMYYIVYEAAIEATIWIRYKSVSASSSDSFRGHGSVMCRYKKRGDWPLAKIQKEYNGFTMFESSSFELKPRYLLKVSRTIVVLPVFHSLSIILDLKRCGDDEQLWSGEVEFIPRDILFDPKHVDLKGEYGVLAVSAVGFRYYESLEEVNGIKKSWRKSRYMP